MGGTALPRTSAFPSVPTATAATGGTAVAPPAPTTATMRVVPTRVVTLPFLTLWVFAWAIVPKLALAIQVVTADLLLIARRGWCTRVAAEHGPTHFVVVRLTFKKQIVIDNFPKELVRLLSMTFGISTVLVDLVFELLGL